MSGLEVLGAISGALQLVDAGLRTVKLLHRLCSTLHDTPTSIKRRATQIEHLIQVARVIEQNPSLQTTLINSLLVDCVAKAKHLQSILDHLTASLSSGKIERYWKAIGGVLKEKKISELCNSLGENKSAIVLCIASIDSDLLRSIDTKLVSVHEGIGELLEELPTIRETAQGVNNILSDLTLVRGLRSNLRRELGCVLDKVSEVAISSRKSEQLLTLPVDFDDNIQSTEIESALPALRQALDRLTLDESTSTNSNTHAPAMQIELEDSLYSKEDRAIECMSSLGATDQTSFLAERLCNQHACRWFLETPEVKSWLSISEVGSQMIYITARAGCGKTTIIAHTISHLKSLFGNLECQSHAEIPPTTLPSHLILYFFFHKRSMEEEGTAVAAMKAMISQLLHQVPEFYPVLLLQYQILSIKGSFSWTLESLWGVFTRILEKLPNNPVVFMVMDGMDECEKESKCSLLERLENLIKTFDSPGAEHRRFKLKVMLSGRPGEELLEVIPTAKQFEITVADTALDMQDLIDTRVRQFSKWRSLNLQTTKNLSEFLTQNANGMFLWVVLVMKELNSRTVRLSDEVIAAKLQSVPTDLFAQYKAILKAVPECRQFDMWRIIRWILNARRILSLSELEVALCCELGSSRWHDLKGDINYLCGSVIRFEDDNVSFIHQTFRDFIKVFISNLEKESAWGIGMGQYDAEAHLATICLKFLRECGYLEELDQLLQQNTTPEDWNLASYLKARPFLAYAAEFWCSHLQAADSIAPTPQTHSMHSLAIEMFDSDVYRQSLWRLYYFSRHSIDPEHWRPFKLQAAAHLKIPFLVGYYLSAGESATDGSPLIWASEGGDFECIDKLIKAGADFNEREFDGWTCLHWTATNGHEEACGLLIRYGAKMNVRDIWGHSPKDMAVQMGRYEIAHKYFGGVEGAKLWTPSESRPRVSTIGHRRAILGRSPS